MKGSEVWAFMGGVLAAMIIGMVAESNSGAALTGG